MKSIPSLPLSSYELLVTKILYKIVVSLEIVQKQVFVGVPLKLSEKNRWQSLSKFIER